MWILRFFKNVVDNYSKHNNLPSSFHRNPDHEFRWEICTLTTAVWNQIQLGSWQIHTLSFLNKTKQKVLSIFYSSDFIKTNSVLNWGPAFPKSEKLGLDQSKKRSVLYCGSDGLRKLQYFFFISLQTLPVLYHHFWLVQSTQFFCSVIRPGCAKTYVRLSWTGRNLV